MIYVEYNGKKFEVNDNKLSLRGQNINSIKEIKGLEKLTDLTWLSLEENKIKEIEGLEYLINLENLFLSKNQISKIEGLDNLMNLKVLALGSNQICEIENVSHLTGLKDLFLDGNNIYKIQNLANLTNLQRLNLSYNRNIEKIEGLENLNQLYNLYLGSNNIREIENLENLIKLIRIGLSANEIKEVKGFDKLNNLQNLELSYNLIEEIKNLDHLKNLKILKLRQNKINYISGLENLNLSTLSMSNNQIREVKGLETLENLTNLDLKGNPIIDQEEFLLNRKIGEVVDYCRRKNQLIKGIIGNGEDERTEYKETFRFDVKELRPNKKLKDEVSHAVCAFLNKYGGELFIGVDNSGKLRGIEQDINTYGKKNEKASNNDSYYQDLTKTIREDLGTNIMNLISIDFIPILNQEIIKITVNRSVEPIFFKGRDFHVRDGPSSPNLNAKQTLDYIKSNFPHFGDAYLDDDEIISINKADLETALLYLEMFKKKEISYTKHGSRILFICQQFDLVIRYQEMEKLNLEICEEFILFAVDLVKEVDERDILNRTYEVLLRLSSNDLTIELMKKYAYDLLSGFYEKGIHLDYIICILVKLGFFDEILLEEIDKEVNKNDAGLISTLIFCDLTRFNKQELLKRLVTYIEILDYDSHKKLVNAINTLVSKIQRLN